MRVRLAPQLSVSEPIYEKQRIASSQSTCTTARWRSSRMHHRSPGADRVPPPNLRESPVKPPKAAGARSVYPARLPRGAARSLGRTLRPSGAPHRTAVSQSRVTPGAPEAGCKGTRVRGGRDWRPRHPPLAAHAKEKGPPPASRRAPPRPAARARGRGQPRGRGGCARAPSSDAQTSLNSFN